ncbi:hypothetical protein F5Y07DRAFT_397837 [Xylaria sp. FL0933]|nr:hypothetical protein F5Y07DRAFT_397837 [Xylaria sp. FL0933]
MASRQSTDSVSSSTPFIQHPTFQPPPKGHVEGHVEASLRNDAATSIKFSVVILAFRILALISGLAVGVSFALLGAWWPMTFALIVFVWITSAWNFLMIYHIIRKPSLRISLVLKNGRTIRFGSPDGDEDGMRRRRCHPRAVWIDLILLCIVFALNIVHHVRTGSYYRTTLSLNWFPITFQIIITLLTAFPALAKAHILFETAETPQISLP